MILTKRAYDPPEKKDGARFLVDRLWPRGIKKEDLKIEDWLKEIAPSHELRKQYKHDPEHWSEFKKKYFSELKEHKDEIARLKERAKDGTVTLVYAARDTEHNNAEALLEYLEKPDHR
jgi:uncharacterized protein YeaO (DUF488 family)